MEILGLKENLINNFNNIILRLVKLEEEKKCAYYNFTQTTSNTSQ